MCLLEPDVGNVAAVAGVPAQRRPSEPLRVVDQEEDELEGVREADEVELGRGRAGHGRVLRSRGLGRSGRRGSLAR